MTFTNRFSVQDSTATNVAAVKPASTPVAATDSPLAVGLHPSSPLPAGANSVGSLQAGVVVSAGNTTSTALSAATLVTTGNITKGSNQLTNLASTAGLAIGQLITIVSGNSTFLPAVTTITGIVGTTVSMSSNANTTSTGVTVIFSAAGAFFTGATEQITPNYSELDINVAGAAASTAPGVLFFEFSPDGTNWDVSVPLSLVDVALGIIPLTLRNIEKFFRVRYVNGAVAQTAFRLTTQYHSLNAMRLTRLLGQTPNKNEPIEGVGASLNAYSLTNGNYPDLTTTLLAGNHQGLDVAAYLTDGTRNASMFPSNLGAVAAAELRVHLEGHQLFYDTFDIGLDTTNRYNVPTAAGGGVAATGSPGTVTLATGTTANGYSYLQSQVTFPPANPGYLQIFHAINLEFPITLNTYRAWGVGTVPATPTAAAPATNAVLFEVTTAGKLMAVCYASGVRNLIQDLSSSGSNVQPADNAVHKYYIFFRGDNIFWAIDSYSNVVASISTGSLGPNINNLPLLELAIAGSVAPASSGVLTLDSIYVADDACNNVQISDATFAFRKQAVKSITAGPQATDYGALTIAAPVDGGKASYSAAFSALVPAAAATDLFTIYGSATKTIRVTQIGLSIESTTITNVPVSVIKRSAVNTGGTSTNPGAVPHDSNNAAATATVLGYTANPTALGAAVGTVRAQRMDAPTAGGGLVGTQTIYDLGVRPSQAIVLRGTAQGLAINLNGSSITGGTACVYIEWTEE